MGLHQEASVKALEGPILPKLLVTKNRCWGLAKPQKLFFGVHLNPWAKVMGWFGSLRGHAESTEVVRGPRGTHRCW